MSPDRIQAKENSVVLERFSVNGTTFCVNCWSELATAVHELEPRSKRPNTWHFIENRVPLCTTCHEWAHSVGTKQSAPVIRKKRDEFVDAFGIDKTGLDMTEILW